MLPLENLYVENTEIFSLGNISNCYISNIHFLLEIYYPNFLVLICVFFKGKLIYKNLIKHILKDFNPIACLPA